jgi:hypothetical protein
MSKNGPETCDTRQTAESFPFSRLGWWNWQTRTFEGRMPKGLRVQVPPRAPFQRWIGFSEGDVKLTAEGRRISG